MIKYFNILSAETSLILVKIEASDSSPHLWSRLKNIELERRRIILFQEQHRRLKIWAIWIKEGDKNTSYFQKYANGRKRINSIWQIEVNGKTVYSTRDIQLEEVNFYKGIFKDRKVNAFTKQVKALEYFPRKFRDEEINCLQLSVTRGEVEWVLKSFPVDKSPGSDGWTPDFFIYFSNILLNDITKMVEVLFSLGNFLGDINYTFFTLIPKKKESRSFKDFRPISLCNTLYYIVSNIIAEILKSILS